MGDVARDHGEELAHGHVQKAEAPALALPGALDRKVLNTTIGVTATRSCKKGKFAILVTKTKLKTQYYSQMRPQ